MKDHGTCSCPHHGYMHAAFGLLVLVFGISGLLKAMGNISAETFSWTWPILIILGGLGKLSTGMCKCC
ncbi:MAG: hypothetical protein HY438_03255 [DPANN group archaeon]|nr:hypothetical protein [DPANN group archaeon]